MEPMPVLASDEHALHDPPYEVNYGRVVRPVYERVARGERLRAALHAAGHPLPAPSGHGLDPVLAVHDRDLVEFLEGAWAGWRAAGGGEALIPDPFPLPRMAGGGPRGLGGPPGRPRWG